MTGGSPSSAPLPSARGNSTEAHPTTAPDDSQRKLESPSVWAIVVGGGSGRRFGRPKQFELIGGSTTERIIDRSVRVAASVCTGVVVVVPPESVADERARFAKLGSFEVDSAASTPGRETGAQGISIRVVGGGDSRSGSVRSGLAQVPVNASYICVHDAARPCASAALYDRVIAAVVAGADAAVPALAVVDTIKVVDDDGWVTSTPPRSSLFAVQTPQAFRGDALRRAHSTGAEGSDDASLIEAVGGRVRVVDGDRTNIKVTHPDDLERLTSLTVSSQQPL